jgi:hypothetical protein
MHYFELPPAEQRRRLDQRQAEASDTTWPMSDEELAEWAAGSTFLPRVNSTAASPIDHPPVGFATWDEWRTHRWLPSVF